MIWDFAENNSLTSLSPSHFLLLLLAITNCSACSGSLLLPLLPAFLEWSLSLSLVFTYICVLLLCVIDKCSSQ